MRPHPPRVCRVALIGTRFMGRAHSNAWLKVARFFETRQQPALQCVAGRSPSDTARFAERWGWVRHTARWRDVIDDPQIDLVDICTPNHLHAEQAIAALEAGKDVACEKPLAGTLEPARAMRDAARRSRARTFVWYNYRRVPAVALAHRLVGAGRIGRIYHVRAVYLQSWGGPQTPLAWRFDRTKAGSGAHGDLNAHLIDMTRFVTGEEIVEVAGAVAETFIQYRSRPSGDHTDGLAVEAADAGRRAAARRPSRSAARGRRGRSTVDDCVLFLARFAGGAVASFEATRLATGFQNWHGFEIHGDRGAMRFCFEDMNVLWFFDATADPATRGWTRILCTAAQHPYAAAWWPDGHVIGYEHTFVHQAADILRVRSGQRPEVPMPDFADAYQTQRVLHAALLSAVQRTPVRLSEIPA